MDIVGTSLGLAGSVLRLVIFSIEFVSDVKQVYHKGATDSNVDLAIVASSIQSATKSLEAQLEESGQQQGTAESAVDPDEKELRILAARAAEIGRELAAGLNKVTAQQKSKWKSLKTAARSMWDAEDLQKTEKRLRGIREELQLRYLTEIKKKVDKLGNESQHRMFDALERIASAQGESTLERKEIIELLIQIEAVNSTRHDELVRLQAQLVAGINALSHVQPSSPMLPGSASDDPSAREKAYGAVLDSLWYPSISDREDSIRDAYADTFGWLYQDPSRTGKPWSSFVDFLQGDTRSYWITGKPGSGKSTLMKFLGSDPRTRERLTPWIAGREFLNASFYFFYGGSDEQKSEHGFLLSLLHGLLEQRRDLITVAFEERYRHHLHTQRRDTSSRPTLREARRALRRLFETQSHIAFFLTVDGLDEFDPKVSTTDIESLLEFGRSLEEFPNVKVIFASRPLNHFQEAFANRPQLRIHDLTYEDIRMYVNERLEKQKNMQSLLNRDPENATKLVRSIVDSSSGVFLWVRLVVDSLLDGLRNYDGIQDLQRRLDELPKDLYHLYEVMLSRVPIPYRSQTTRLLKLVNDTAGFELSVLGLWFAEQATDEMVVDTQVSPIKDEDLEYYYKQMERRLKSRCLDLVEIRPSNVTTQTALGDMSRAPQTDIYDIGNNFLNAQVTFLHRSVSEILDKFDWAAFSVVGNADMDIRLALLRSLILMIKTYRYDHQRNWSILLKMAELAGIKARRVVDAPASTLLNTLDSTMSRHLTNLRAIPETNWEIPKTFRSDPGADSHWAAWRDFTIGAGVGDCWDPKHLQNRKSNFATFAIDHQLLIYLKDQVAINGPGFLQKPGLSALGHALCVRFSFGLQIYSWPDVASLLLEIGFKHTDMFEGKSVWTWFFHSILEQVPDFEPPPWLTMNRVLSMVHLLERGASTDEWLWVSIGRLHKVSLLRGARFGPQYCETHTRYYPPKERRELISTLRRMESVLQERGAIEEEWINKVLVYPPTSQHGANSHTGGTLEQSTIAPSTSTDIDGLGAQVSPNVPTGTSEDINTKSLDDASPGKGTQNMTKPPPRLDAAYKEQKDIEATPQVPTLYKHRRSLSLWLKRLGGGLRSAEKG